MVGERLTELRVKHNMTQEEFAEYMCVTRQSVSKWETDKAYPDVEKMIKIAELYGVSLDYLIRGKEPEPVIEKVETINEHHIDDSTLIIDNIPKTEEVVLTSVKHKDVDLKICVGISAVFCILPLTIIIMFLLQNPWFHSDITEQQVKVDAVYNQLSMAQVSYENESGEVISELVLLDIANIGQGDYINLYSNEAGNIFIDYEAGILTAIIVFLVVNLLVAVLLVKELKRT